MQAETQRQVEHMAPVVFAALLRWLPLWAAASLAALSVVYGGVVSSRLFGRTLREDEAPLGFSPGKVIYGAVVLAMILVFQERGFHVVAGAWALLGIGDGMSNIIGRRFGRAKIPWNRDKSWEGAAAFVAFGTLAAGLLIWLVGARDEGPQLSLGWSMLWALVAAVPAALVETLANRILDDNITVPAVGAVALYLATMPEPFDATLSMFVALSLTAALGFASWKAGAVNASGLFAGLVIGAAVAVTLGLPGWLVLAAMFVLGTACTRWHYDQKMELGIAEESGGRRSWAHATAKCAAAVACAVAARLTSSDTWTSTLFVLGFVAALATAAMDTVSSELGPLYGRVTVLPPSFRRVTPGTEGAVSVEGTLLGLAGAAVVALLASALGLVPLWLSWAVVVGAFVGTSVESLLGAGGLGKTRASAAWLNVVNTAVGAAVAMLFGGIL